MFAVGCAVDGELSATRKAKIVTVEWNNKGGLGLSIQHDGKAERTAMAVGQFGDRQSALDNVPSVSAIVAAMHAAMLLPEKHGRLRRIIGDVMDALARRCRRRVDCGIDPFVLRLPRLPTVIGAEEAGGRY